MAYNNGACNTQAYPPGVYVPQPYPMGQQPYPAPIQPYAAPLAPPPYNQVAGKGNSAYGDERSQVTGQHDARSPVTGQPEVYEEALSPVTGQHKAHGEASGQVTRRSNEAGKETYHQSTEEDDHFYEVLK